MKKFTASVPKLKIKSTSGMEKRMFSEPTTKEALMARPMPPPIVIPLINEINVKFSFVLYCAI